MTKQKENLASLHALVRDSIEGSLEAKRRMLLDPSFHDRIAHVALRIVDSLRSGGASGGGVGGKVLKGKTGFGIIGLKREPFLCDRHRK